MHCHRIEQKADEISCLIGLYRTEFYDTDVIIILLESELESNLCLQSESDPDSPNKTGVRVRMTSD